MNKIKLLFISDDIRSFTGVGIQSKKLLQGLQKTGNYDIIQLAGSNFHKPGTIVDVEGIKIYTTNKVYGDSQSLREVIHLEQPDIVVAFSDPRFFEYLFLMDNEIRKTSKLVFYHTWDNAPFPKYNLPYYASCDRVVMLSQFSYDLMRNNGVPCEFIPHGGDSAEFFKLPAEVLEKERKIFLETLVGRTDIDFVIGWNNKNMTRKRPSDIIETFRKFSLDHPHALLFLHTDQIASPDGNDLHALAGDLCKERTAPIVFNTERIGSDKLNLFYNLCDVTLNLTYNAGFELCVMESLLAETPVIATKTGGITSQLSNGTETFGALVEPAMQELFGCPGTPYIYRDMVNVDDVVEELKVAYQLKQRGAWKQTLGVAGRKHILQNFHIENTIEKWNQLLLDVYNKPSKFKPWEIDMM